MFRSILTSILFAGSVAAQTQSIYGQCGGNGWDGPTACPTGAYCVTVNDNEWYSQCLPPEADSGGNIESETILTTIYGVGDGNSQPVTTFISYLTPNTPDAPMTTFITYVTESTPTPDEPVTTFITYLTPNTPTPTQPSFISTITVGAPDSPY